ncbi:MAG TPA: hypothetical protein VGI06_17515, partial [Acidimicrobiales bacterium]
MDPPLTALGRGVVVSPGGDAPPPFAAAPRIRVDDDVLAAPDTAVGVLHRHWLGRLPVVVELAVSSTALRTAAVDSRPPWEVGVGFDLARDRLQFLVWANNWDARGPDPVWWWGRKATRLGARAGG